MGMHLLPEVSNYMCSVKVSMSIHFMGEDLEVEAMSTMSKTLI